LRLSKSYCDEINLAPFYVDMINIAGSQLILLTEEHAHDVRRSQLFKIILIKIRKSNSTK